MQFVKDQLNSNTFIVLGPVHSYGVINDATSFPSYVRDKQGRTCLGV